MSDFYEEWASQFLSWANEMQFDATVSAGCEEAASELLSLARACREAEAVTSGLQ